VTLALNARSRRNGRRIRLQGQNDVNGKLIQLNPAIGQFLRRKAGRNRPAFCFSLKFLPSPAMQNPAPHV